MILHSQTDTIENLAAAVAALPSADPDVSPEVIAAARQLATTMLQNADQPRATLHIRINANKTLRASQCEIQLAQKK